MDDLIRKLIIQEKLRRIDNFSEKFNKKLKEKGLTLEDIIKSCENIRKEILKERNII
ncbi:MAG: hypothetical protein ACP6IY_17560 [Promethearchaeia archaeon]